jgi:hypothetical protein
MDAQPNYLSLALCVIFIDIRAEYGRFHRNFLL